MLNFFYTLIIVSTIFTNLTAQNGEVSLSYQFGIAGSRLRADNNSQDKFSKGKNGDLHGSIWLYDHVIHLNYKHPFIKRWKLMWNIGIERGSFERYNNIFLNGIIYDVVKHDAVRMEYQIGLNKRFELKNSKISFDLGFDMSYRKYKFALSSGSASEYQPSYPYGTVEYEYDYFHEDFNFGYSYRPKILNFELQTNVHFPLIKNLYLDAGLRLATNYFEYQYVKYTIRQYDNDGNIQFQYNLTSAGAPSQRVGSYVYLNLGLSYRFNWQNIRLFQQKEKQNNVKV